LERNTTRRFTHIGRGKGRKERKEERIDRDIKGHGERQDQQHTFTLLPSRAFHNKDNEHKNETREENERTSRT
jgi:hypothetical protein